ncbi:MAG: hypothetical protein HC769_06620 [Cyanobacteria bacterium CRU_2_1]|nr:hypothetical protein [Cyanobacteria bacterium RU_5_0]NJR58554.1 hypothetical protein [Cyanobacteria bacterium CRU_2_1]
MRDRVGNSIQRAFNLGKPIPEYTTRKEYVGQSDREDVYRFSMNDRYGMTMLLSGVAKNANVGLRLFRMDKNIPNALRRKAFSQLKPNEIRKYLTPIASINAGRTSKPWSQELNAGEYIVQVFNRKKGSRYSLSLRSQRQFDPPSPGTPEPPPAIPIIQFSQAIYRADEGTGTATVTLTRTATDLASSVQVNITGGTAQAGADYNTTNFPFTVEFAAGELRKTVSIPISQDTSVESTESIAFSLTDSTNATIGSINATTLEIRDDDSNPVPLPSIQFSQATYQSNEGAGTATITLTRTASTLASSVQVNITESGTAQAGADYTGSAFPVTVNFTAGETSKTLSIPIVQDTIAEGTESIAFSLSNLSNARIGTTNTTTLRLEDDDSNPVPLPSIQFLQANYQANEGTGSASITLTRTASPLASSVQVSITGGTAQAGADYNPTNFPFTVNFAAGEVSKTISIPINQDTAVESGETIAFSLVNLLNATAGATNTTTLEIIDDDANPVPLPSIQFSQATYQTNEGAGTVNITLTRTASPLASSAQVSITGGTAQAGSDYTNSSFPVTVNFAAGEVSKTVSIPINQDTAVEGTETIGFSLSNSVNATIGTTRTTTLQIADDDTNPVPLPSIQFSQATYQANEGSGTVNITLTRTASTLASSVQVSLAGGTAQAGTDYNGNNFPVTVNFAAGETSKIVSIPINQDSTVEGAETIGFSLSNSANATIGATNATTLRIEDDDTEPIEPNKFGFSGNPNGPTYRFEIDFSKFQDSDPTENRGRFVGAVSSGSISNFNGSGSEDLIYQPGNLVSFKRNTGETVYEAELSTGTVSDEVFYLRFVVPASSNADPDSLANLESAMVNGAVKVLYQAREEAGLNLADNEFFGSPAHNPNAVHSVDLTYTLPAGQQNFTVEGNASGGTGTTNVSQIYVIGNALNNTIIGSNVTTSSGNTIRNNLEGLGGNDNLQGRNGFDELDGGAGNDTLLGGSGDDRLNGYGTIVNDISQIDTLIGGAGVDRFVLGGDWGVSYVESGDGYAIIQDWQPGQDVIIQSNNSGQYTLQVKNVIGSSAPDTEIYYSATGTSLGDRIAIIQDSTNVNIPRDFQLF